MFIEINAELPKAYLYSNFYPFIKRGI